MNKASLKSGHSHFVLDKLKCEIRLLFIVEKF